MICTLECKVPHLEKASQCYSKLVKTCIELLPLVSVKMFQKLLAHSFSHVLALVKQLQRMHLLHVELQDVMETCQCHQGSKKLEIGDSIDSSALNCSTIIGHCCLFLCVWSKHHT